MNKHVEIGKLEAARRHLEVAIRMFFEQKDPVAIYTVAWSAYQILSDICKKKGIERQVEDNPILVEFGVKKEFMAAFRAPRNFFHHADRDDKEVIKFFPDTSFLIPLLATELIEKLDGIQFWYGRVLMMWFYINNPNYAPEDIKTNIAALPLPHKDILDDYSIFIELLDRSSN